MKKKLIIALSAIMIIGLAAVVFAYKQTETNRAHSCPMKNETASKDKKHSCCGMEDCCKDGVCKMSGECCGDSCEMKNAKKSSKETAEADYSHLIFSDDSGNDCCVEGADCCKDGGGDCCKGKHS